MKKKVLSVLLAVCLLVGALPMFASAEEERPNVEGMAAIRVEVDHDTPYREIELDEPFQTIATPETYDPNGGSDQTIRGDLDEQISKVSAITEDTKFKVTNIGTEKNAYIYIYLHEYLKGRPNTGYVCDFHDASIKKFPIEGLYTHGRYVKALVNPNDNSDNGEGVFGSGDIPTKFDGLAWRTYADIVPWPKWGPLIKLCPGESVSFTLPAEEWECFYQMFVNIAYPDIPWNEWKYFNLLIDEDLATSNHPDPAPVNPDPEPPTQFTDVPAGAYYADAVKWAVENNITAGTDKTHFSPNASCTRAQAVTFLWRAAGEPEPQNTTTKFNDVKAGSYYEKAVQWAVENGVTAGTGETTFSPNATCTRAQIVTFLYRAENSPEITGNNSFNDVKTGAYYENAVKWAVENNITSGTGGNKFSPDNNCVRGQIVTFLYRYSK